MSGVTLRRLEVFIAIIETGGFASAADRLGISQPSVSAHIKALEEEARGALFERRRGQRVTLTPRGASFRAHAESMLAEASQMQAGTNGRRSRAHSRIIFACETCLASFFLISRLAPFANCHEEHEFVVRVSAQKDVLSQLRSGAADIGYILSNSDPTGLASSLVGRQGPVNAPGPQTEIRQILSRGGRRSPRVKRFVDFLRAKDDGER